MDCTVRGVHCNTLPNAHAHACQTLACAWAWERGAHARARDMLMSPRVYIYAVGMCHPASAGLLCILRGPHDNKVAPKLGVNLGFCVLILLIIDSLTSETHADDPYAIIG